MFDKRLFACLSLSFFAMVVVGTLSHELGHFFAGRYLGYSMHISYAFTYSTAERAVTPFHSLLITLCGPLQTIATGTLGLLLLYSYRQSFRQRSRLVLWQWVILFVSSFWLRQTVNSCIWLAGYIVNGAPSTCGDELKIAAYWHLPQGSILLFLGFVGALVFGVILFRYIPAKQRFTFIAAGFVGGFLGYAGWLLLFGKYVMP